MPNETQEPNTPNAPSGEQDDDLAMTYLETRQADNSKDSQSTARGLGRRKVPALWFALLLLLMLPGLNLVYSGVWRRGWTILSLAVLGYALQISLSLYWAPQSHLILILVIGGLLALHGLCFVWSLADNLVSYFRFRRHGYPRPLRRLGPWLACGLGALVVLTNGLGLGLLYLKDTSRSLHPFSVPSGSMQPSLKIGDMFIAVRPTTRPLVRGDILVFKTSPSGSGNYYVKRLIGLPGDRIALEDHRAVINGVSEEWHSRDPSDPGAIRACLSERCYDLQIDRPDLAYGARMSERILGADEYFFLGDHRDQSLDSRFASMGTIPRAQILFRGYHIYWPLDRWQRLL